jgi:hypothetical protein
MPTIPIINHAIIERINILKQGREASSSARINTLLRGMNRSTIDSRIAARLQKVTVLRVATRYDRLSIMSALVLAGFLTVCVGVDFCHDHDCESDAEPHDMCPACQWNNLHQDDYSGAHEICEMPGNSITLISNWAASQVLIIPSDVSGKTVPSRGPPSSA